MAFKASEEILGKPNFGLIRIDPVETAKAFQAYLETASNLTGVSLDDIQLRVSEPPPAKSEITLTWLLDHGMKLFDAIIWLTAGKPESHPLRTDPTLVKDGITSLHDVARAVFYCYFMLVVQARYPVSEKNKEKPKVPNFLKAIMGLDDEQHVYVERVCSFEPQKFDPTWVKHVQFSGLGQQVLSRFGLGVAGYRMFGPFGLYSPKAGLSAELSKSFAFAKTMAKTAPTWDVHPLTRHPTVLTKRGNLNKNLNNLILECFTTEQIDEMVKAKVLFGKPTYEPTHRNYLQWDAADDISGNTTIFLS